MVFNKARLLLNVLFFFLLHSGCGTGNRSEKRIFRYNETTGIASLDPAFAKNQSIMWAVHQLYSTLVEVDGQLELKPLLAKNWEFSTDKKSILFNLRTDIYFHNDAAFPGGKGRKLVAEDVRYSLNRIVDAATASPGAWIFNNRADSVKPFVVINDSTFQLNLLRPFHPILGILSMQYCSIVPKEAVEKYGTDFRRHAVGSGPFQLVAWEEGQALVMKKNEHYFEKDSSGNLLPYLDGIKVNFYDSKATEFLEFRQGRLDFINDIDASFKDEILTKTGNLKKQWEGTLRLNKQPYLNIEYFGILHDTNNVLLKNSPLKLKQIRQAINYAINRKKMMLYLRNSIGTAAESGFIPQGLPSFDADKVKGYSYDIEKAKQLLTEAGYPAGKGLPEIKLLTIPTYLNLASYVANELKQVGINIQVESIQKSLLLEQTSKSQALFFRGSWIADYPDAENYLSVFYSKNPAPPNYTRYKNTAFDKLYEQSLREENDSLRYELYRQMDRHIIEDAPVVPFWYDMAIHMVHTNISSFYPNSLNMLELRRVRKR
ncbi:MAG: ABC transporter substrate-binding protein [Rhizobacter sp.]|nr:ABC transporter substrate-binding protein [Ferruginibacter sp.]